MQKKYEAIFYFVISRLTMYVSFLTYMTNLKTRKQKTKSRIHLMGIFQIFIHQVLRRPYENIFLTLKLCLCKSHIPTLSQHPVCFHCQRKNYLNFFISHLQNRLCSSSNSYKSLLQPPLCKFIPANGIVSLN